MKDWGYIEVSSQGLYQAYTDQAPLVLKNLSYDTQWVPTKYRRKQFVKIQGGFLHLKRSTIEITEYMDLFIKG
jgi:hypothetical protein